MRIPRNITGPMKKRALILVLLVGAFAASASAAERAWYGFHIKPETAGFPLNPIVRSVTIDKIKPGSPAAAQKIAVGDEIVEADGKTVPGARALQLLPVVNKRPGDSLHLRLRRATGEDYSVVVQGIRKPDA